MSRIAELISALRARPRRVLALAVVASALVHLALTLSPMPASGDVESPPPLVATITELPPPPTVAALPSPKPKRRPHAAIAFAAPAPMIPESVSAPSAELESAPLLEPPPVVADRPLDEPALAPSLESPPPPKQLPPRIDLAYRAYLGTHGLFIGDAIYRLEHSANQYRISTVAEARGLAALLFHGQARAMSEGAITSAGLQPNSYSIERTSNYRRESATFDWESGMVLLNDDKSAPLEIPTFDPLVVLWQFYFAPPEQDETQFNIATTRKVYRYSFHRIGSETLTLPFGEVETQVWRRHGGDGSIDAQVWLAPSLHFVAVKLRLSNDRATIEAVLDSIRVDDTVARQ